MTQFSFYHILLNILHHYINNVIFLSFIKTNIRLNAIAKNVIETLIPFSSTTGALILQGFSSLELPSDLSKHWTIYPYSVRHLPYTFYLSLLIISQSRLSLSISQGVKKSSVLRFVIRQNMNQIILNIGQIKRTDYYINICKYLFGMNLEVERQIRLNITIYGLDIFLSIVVSLSSHASNVQEIVNNYLKSQTQDLQFYKTNMMIFTRYGVYIKGGTMQQIVAPLNLSKTNKNSGQDVIAYVDINPTYLN